METSSLKYELNLLQSTVSPKTYTDMVSDEFYYGEDSSGIMVLRKVELSAEDKALYETAKASYDAKDYKGALKTYHRIYKDEPGYAPLMTDMAMAHLSDDNSDSCFYYLEKAKKRNYSYYKPHYLYGLIYALAAANKENKDKTTIDKAMFYTAIAHVLDRNNEEIRILLQSIIKQKKLKWIEFEFNPQFDLSLENEETVHVNASLEYLWYANAKAVWKYEPGFAKKQNVPNPELSIIAENDALYGVYHLANNVEPDDKKLKATIKSMNKKPEIKALKKAWENGLGYAFGLYESILPKAPAQVYTLSEDQVNDVAVYVLLMHSSYLPKD